VLIGLVNVALYFQRRFYSPDRFRIVSVTNALAFEMCRLTRGRCWEMEE